MPRESTLLEHIYRRSANLRAQFPHVLLGPGDDCAAIDVQADSILLLTTDQIVEGRHFLPSTPVNLIARKAVARSVSDIAAMGGAPRWALAAVMIPDGFAPADDLFDAAATWATHFGCPFVGGDITSGPVLQMSITIGGVPATPRGIVPRSGARPGDELWATGLLGGSLESGRHLTFEPRLNEARALCERLGGGLHAMIDISDGLGRDAGRMAAASGVEFRIDAGAIPLNAGVGGWRQAVSDGEDYELLFTAAPGACTSDMAAPTPLTRIGRVGSGSGCFVNDEYGRAVEVSDMGWDHGAPGAGPS